MQKQQKKNDTSKKYTRTKTGKMLGKKIAGKTPASKQSIAKKVKTLVPESFKTVSSVTSVSKTVSSETITRPERKRKNEQVCGKCSVTFDMPRDKTLLKNYKYQWIGCEVESCQFWAHTACVGVDMCQNDDAKTVTFFCEEHKWN